MERIFIANIGQRDLRLDHESLAESDAALADKLARALGAGKPNLRKWAGLLLEHFDAVAPYLSAPILSAALDDLALRGETPTRVVLVGTKQEDKAFLSGDTFRCAEALCRLLPMRISGNIPIDAHTVSASPHDLNQMLDEYARLCAGIHADQVHALCTGGTPACNMALSLRTVEYFGENCTVMYVAEGSATATRLNIGRYILDQHRRTALERLAVRGDFDAIAEDAGYAQPVRSLARAAALRLNFNFKESLNILQRIQCACVADTLAPLVEAGRCLAQENNRGAALAEVYWNALLKWRRDECADCLGRVWRLIEGSLQDVIGAAIGYDRRRDRFAAVFSIWTRKQPTQYQEYVQSKFNKKATRAAAESLGTGIPVLIATLSYFIKHDPDAVTRAGLDTERAKQIKQAAGALRPLTDLRNASVIAHGFGGVWKGRILQELKADNDDAALFTHLRSLLAAQGINPGTDPFERFGRAFSFQPLVIEHDVNQFFIERAELGQGIGECSAQASLEA